MCYNTPKSLNRLSQEKNLIGWLDGFLITTVQINLRIRIICIKQNYIELNSLLGNIGFPNSYSLYYFLNLRQELLFHLELYNFLDMVCCLRSIVDKQIMSFFYKAYFILLMFYYIRLEYVA